MWWSPTTREDSRDSLGMCNLYRILRTVQREAHRGPSREQVLRQVLVPERLLGAVEEPFVGSRSSGDKAKFEFLATPGLLALVPQSVSSRYHQSDLEDHYMVATTIADNELLERNRRALDAALRWMDLPPEVCTIESARTIMCDIVNFLLGRSIGPTPTSTTPATATGTSATSGPTEAGPRQSQHGSTSTRSTSATAQPATLDARPPKRMHGKEYQMKNLKKPKQ
ncbi:hypothetical protein Scep_013647 [Stephania cephalantha]|uniref:Uncharacterized protein n=1 Tax=Stephania cephalantha TaxID=152367 RepID=A0AAP0JHW0_9MAGN